MREMGILRLSLLANAALSLVTGVLIGFFASSLSKGFGLNSHVLFHGFAVILLGHALILLSVLRRADLSVWARLNLVFIIPYPPALLAYYVWGPELEIGMTNLVLADAFAVALVAAWQVFGLAQNRSR